MRNIIFVLFVMFSAIAIPAVAHAEDKIAVVDVQLLLNDSKAGKSIQAQLKKQRDSFKDEFSKLEKELNETQKKLSEEKDQKSEGFLAKKKDFETRMMSANKLVQDRRQSLESAASESLMELRKQIVKVVAEISEKESYTLVITRQNVVLAEKDRDITEQVMKQLDKQLPDLKLNVGAAKAEDKKKS